MTVKQIIETSCARGEVHYLVGRRAACIELMGRPDTPRHAALGAVLIVEQDINPRLRELGFEPGEPFQKE